MVGMGGDLAQAQSGLTSIRVASGLTLPVYLASPLGDLDRVFIVERPGQIKIFTGGVVLATPFLDITSIVNSSGSERGLLGLAFHPDYFNNGFFYVNYTQSASPSGATVVARYTVQGDPATSNQANPANAVILKVIPQPESNHNGGDLEFGPDGMLYVSVGDGGGANDQHGTDGNAQDSSTLLGKILRLDVDSPPDYIPADNPFVGPGDPLDEIWAMGLRNPWRFSFDSLTGAMYIADVGQGTREEISFQPVARGGGENYGWRCMEGTWCTSLSGCTCNDPGLTLPFDEYSHDDGKCSITGGYVYRGPAISGLQGAYFFADFCSSQIWSLRFDGVNVTQFQERTAELTPDVGSISSISSFGQDGARELYIIDYSGGEVFKIVPACVSDPECDDGIFCNGAERCDAELGCTAGTDPCPGQSCDETWDTCVLLVCNDNGMCEAGEDCNNCPSDCVSGNGPGAVCGNGICEAGDGEDCLSCSQDCNGKQNGPPSGRFCCGDGAGRNPVGCNDELCTSGGFHCTNDPSPTIFCCGDSLCESGESCSNCALDCQLGSEVCDDSMDNDCDGLADCADLSCGEDPGCPQCTADGQPCRKDQECCSFNCSNGPPSSRTCQP